MKSVILCNEQGQTSGEMEILEAHTNGGSLHKAFSVFVFTPDRKKLLIQKRSEEKLLWPGYWSNTCCSHPKGLQPIEKEAEERLEEECGFRCPLKAIGSFVYKADDPAGNGTEHEYDTVLIGEMDESVELNLDPKEVMDCKWVDVDELRKDMEEHPERYTAWFGKALEIVISDL